MDETFDEFRENFKKIKEKRQNQHQAQISKFLTPSQPSRSSTASLNNETSSKLSFEKLDESIEIPKTQELKKHKSLNDSKSDISKYFSKNENLKCPVCSFNLIKLLESERDKHVNQCLDRKSYLNFEYKPTNKFRQNENEDLDQKIQSIDDTAGKTAFKETQKKISESLLKEAVPNCPICGRVLHNFNIRQNHLKKCSQVFQIRTESLVELVRKQQEKIELEISKGLIPTDAYIPKTKKQVKDDKKAKISNRVIKLEQPKSKNEEQLQIAVALSNSLNPAEDCPKQAEIKLFKSQKKNDKKGQFESVLLLVDEATRIDNVSNKFSKLLETKIKYENPCNISESFFVKTKFNSDKNYLWNKCRYFKENENSFYVQAFLKTGRFAIGHQVFIDKIDQEKFTNIEVINTQTAFLLADLNDQTQENLSIYYTQSQSHFQSNYEGYQTLDSICEFDEKRQSENSKFFLTDQDNTTKETLSILEEKNNKFEIEEEQVKDSEFKAIQSEEEINDKSDTLEYKSNIKDNETDLDDKEVKPNLISLLEETIFDPNDSLSEKNDVIDHAILIDETHLSTFSIHKNNSNDIASEDSECSNDKNSNILDQNIMEESEESVNDENDKFSKTEINTEEILLSDDSVQSKENKKRKSIDIIELNDTSSSSLSPKQVDNNKKFKSDLNIIDEEIQIILDESVKLKNKSEKNFFDESSSSSLPSLDNHEPMEVNEIDYDFDSKKNEEKNVLILLEKSQLDPNQPNDNALDEVWRNFGDEQFDCQLTLTSQANDNWNTEPVDKILDPTDQFKNKNYDSNPISNNDSDSEICKFLNKYSEKSNNSKKKSENSTLDEEDLETISSDKEPINSPIKSDKTCKKNLNKNEKLKNSQIDTLKILPKVASMDTPELKSELKKFGVKALPKKQAVKKLTEIYEFTSRKQNKNSFTRSQSCMNFKTGSIGMKNSRSINEINSNKIIENKNLEDTDQDLDSMAKIMNLESIGTQKSKHKVLKKTVSDLGAFGSSQLKSNFQSGFVKIGSKKNKNLEMTLDEVMLDMVDEEDDDETSEASESSGTQVKKNGKLLKEKAKKTFDENETRECVLNILKSDNNVYLSVLNYEPLDYELFFTTLQASISPRKCNNKILMKVLDEFCITFTLKNLNTRGASKVRSKKKH